MGIEADRFVIGDYKVEELYIKLDKKLTLTAKKILIPQQRENAKVKDIEEIFDKIKFIFTFFDKIDLDNIVFDNTNLQFYFQNNILDFNTESYHIRGTIEKAEKFITAKINECFIKKQNIRLHGNLNYNLQTEKVIVEGDYDAYHIQGHFIAQRENEHVDFKINSTKFNDLRTLIETIPMQKSIRAWIVDKVEAKHYTLNSLSGEVTLNEEGLSFNFDTLTASVLFEKVKIHYRKNLAPILADSFLLSYKNRGLYFDLKNPNYKGRSLEKSKVVITGLGKNTLLHLDLHIQSAIDKTLQHVLDAYAIKIPVMHQGEDATIDVNLTIPLGKDIKQYKKHITVEVKVGEGNVHYSTIQLPVKKLHAIYDNSKKEKLRVNVSLKKGIAKLGTIKIPVLSGKGVYAQNIVVLKHVHIKEHWYDSDVDGLINIKKKNGTLELDIKKLGASEKKNFLNMKGKKLSVKIDYSNEIKVDISQIGLKFTINNGQLSMNSKHLKHIKPYLYNLPSFFNDGTLKLKQKGKNRFTFSGILKREACFFYDTHHKLCHTKVPYKGYIDSKGIQLYAFSKRVHYDSKKAILYLKNINIDLKKLINIFSKENKGSKIRDKLVIVGKNSTLRYGKYRLLTDSYDIEISSKGNISAVGTLDGNIVKFTKKGKHFSLKALRVTDKMLHPLIGFSGLKEGRYTLTLEGNPEENMKGKIIVEGGVMSDFELYNNTLAFVNTLPAIATLSDPGFSDKGFTIKEGLVEYHIDKTTDIIFDSIYIKGRSATVVGSGNIDIKKQHIDMQLAIRTARELGNIVSHVPLLGYILMGKDKSFTMGLNINGALLHPRIKTSTMEDILTLPLDLIRRIVESPVELMNK